MFFKKNKLGSYFNKEKVELIDYETVEIEDNHEFEHEINIINQAVSFLESGGFLIIEDVIFFHLVEFFAYVTSS